MNQDSEKTTVDLLRRLTLAPGTSGAEEGVRAVVRDAVGEVPGLKISYDKLGSLLMEKPGTAEKPRVLLDAHLDEVGFMIQNINEDGNLSFVTLGGWWAHVLLAQRVDVLTETGIIPGVIGSKPPHFLSSQERNNVMKIESMHIDVGATTKEEAEKYGIQVGDAVVPHTEFIPMSNPRILSSKAFDNRAGVGLLVETLLALQEKKHPNVVIGVGAVQEEIGCRGAVTATALARPDVGIILEGTPADDIPGTPPSKRQAVMGKGPQIRLADPTAISNRSLVRFVRKIAEEMKIPVQMAVRRGGGTDAKSVHLYHHGVPTVVIGIPARHIHTNVSFMHLDDFFAARKLVINLVCSLSEESVESL